jgi:hypothetical protein
MANTTGKFGGRKKGTKNLKIRSKEAIKGIVSNELDDVQTAAGTIPNDRITLS